MKLRKKWTWYNVGIHVVTMVAIALIIGGIKEAAFLLNNWLVVSYGIFGALLLLNGILKGVKLVTYEGNDYFFEAGKFFYLSFFTNVFLANSLYNLMEMDSVWETGIEMELALKTNLAVSILFLIVFFLKTEKKTKNKIMLTALNTGVFLISATALFKSLQPYLGSHLGHVAMIPFSLLLFIAITVFYLNHLYVRTGGDPDDVYSSVPLGGLLLSLFFFLFCLVSLEIDDNSSGAGYISLSSEAFVYYFELWFLGIAGIEAIILLLIKAGRKIEKKKT